MKLISWLASFFDENTSTSFSRGITLIIVAFILGWDTYAVKFNHQTITGTLLIEQMVAASTFYFIRRAAGTVESTRSPRNGQSEPK
jgi:hypothetical protein